MNVKTLLSLCALTATLAACGGDIELSPSNTTVDNRVITNDGTPAADVNPCAQYGATQGTFSSASGNCSYSSSFVSDTNPLTENLLIPALANNGIHIFEDSLWVGNDVDLNAANAGVAVPQAGQGPKLTIEAGTRIAFAAPDTYLRIARGSQLIADGTAAAPIILSAIGDLIDGTATPADRGLWGGIQINGNGVTNKCTDDQRAALGSTSTPHNCHVTAEGRPSTYGGTNNTESSGTLRYLVIKHAGFEVVDGDELNGLTLNAVGSGTTIEFVQTYTTLDDGFEMFGGAVNLKNIVAVNAGDDSIDYSEGYAGNIQFALVVHSAGSNRCIEGDNTGGGRADNLEPLTKLRISNLTCITSNVDEGAGGVLNAPTSKGDSEGPLFREGAYFELYNSIITSNADGMASNECIEVADSEGPETSDAANNGISTIKSTFVACTETIKMSNHANSTAFADSSALADWVINDMENTDNVALDDTIAGDLPATIIIGLADSDTAYITAAAFTNGNSGAINIPVYDVSTLEDMPADANTTVITVNTPPVEGASGSSSFFEQVDFIGAVSADNDWVSGWTVGL